MLVALAAAAACSGAPRDRAPAAAARDVATLDSLATLRARAAADGLGRDLQGRLLQQLDAGGPLAAVAFCADSAQAFTARHAREGVVVRRVSTRARNPANAPDSMELRALAVFAGLHGAGEPAKELIEASGEGGTRELRYLRPIVIQERCLACHGDPAAMHPAVRRLIAERYPADQATGYRAGDLRGAISVRLPVGE
jgi:hypothetical protein